MEKKNFIGRICDSVKKEFSDFGRCFTKGDWKTRLSFLFIGLGIVLQGQVIKGIIFMAITAVFIFYMLNSGWYWLYMLPSLGKVGPSMTYNAEYDTYVYQYNDNSFQILLYGILTIIFIFAMILLWRMNIKQAYDAQVRRAEGRKVNRFIDDIKSLVDEKFYKTLLTLPVLGITVFMVIPIIFMIAVAFTNYDGRHDGYVTNLFTWVGWENFSTMFSTSKGAYFSTFMGILGWTFVWAIFATFSCYFLGILVALMINKQGIKFKKLWRTILVMTIAIPQFVSLLYVSKMFDKSGIVNGFLIRSGILDVPYDFWGHPGSARALIIIINIWIGIPYLMIMATGILMNIPQDLYEAAKIDGASPVQQFRHITMPYMLFVTAPYLLTSFTGNMNNFNVIYLLTSGGPTNGAASTAAGNVGYTDLLVTWLFKITQGADSSFYMASVIGIIIFIVVASVTLIVYGLLPSTRNEEDMQ